MTAAVLTPMANPTVEAEFRALLPPTLPWVTGRLVSDEPDSMKRLVAYAEGMAGAMRQFDSLALSAVAFACTGSSYLVGRERQAELDEAISVPVIWATDAIERRLAMLGARRIAVVSPYPPELHASGLTYWRKGGLEIVFDARVDIGSADTRAIYALGSDAANEALESARAARPDAILLSGTGMPTLPLLDPDGTPPVVSSNLCLADALVAAVGDRS
ncbi:Maleate isomerase [Tsuneonella dongtanensis]|uniref:Maleate isomerase n=1 Tax=Tsuneonella dongtanensis TaxID=692370 RepID=A0A1B2AGC2_9SPHN|nr:hypothetical protein [Tsuneonella dongtanensis]ANY21075.1 Maleate isomerase [Tsuneonella dongtanensis]